MIRIERVEAIRSFIRAIATNSMNDRRAILQIVRETLQLPEETPGGEAVLRNSSGRVFTPDEAARRFARSRRWLQLEIKNKKIFPIVSGNRSIGFTEAEIERYIRENQAAINTQEAKPQEAMHEAEA